MLFSILIWIKFLFDLQICNILENFSLSPFMSFWVLSEKPTINVQNMLIFANNMILKMVRTGLGIRDTKHIKNKLVDVESIWKIDKWGGTVTDNIPLGAMRVCAKPPFRDSYIGMLKLCYSVDRTDPDKKNYHGFCRGWNRSICNMLRDIFEKWLKFTVSKWFITF